MSQSANIKSSIPLPRPSGSYINRPSSAPPVRSVATNGVVHGKK